MFNKSYSRTTKSAIAPFISRVLFYYQCGIYCIGSIEDVTEIVSVTDAVWVKAKQEFIKLSDYIAAQSTHI